MIKHRFTLEPYKGVSTRHRCPACKRIRCFARYIDTEGKIQFPSYVGRCDHENSCSYHLTPKQYFAENPERKKELLSTYRYHAVSPILSPSPQPSFVEWEMVQKTLKNYEQNNLYLFLANRFGVERAMRMMRQYSIGTSKYWNGATIFWQIDVSERVRTGKIMLYNPDTGKRIKTPYNHITWVHSLQKLPNFNLRQCFFGEYLLSQEIQKPVAIVESEKTALIASHYLPQYLWIATGGKNGCFRSHNLTPLLKRQIVLFPDLGAADYWQKKLKMMRDIGLEVHLFDYLEKQAPPDDLRAGYDIADYLLKIETKKENPENLIQHAQNYPKEDENVKTNIGDNAPKTKPMPRKKGIKF